MLINTEWTLEPLCALNPESAREKCQTIAVSCNRQPKQEVAPRMYNRRNGQAD